MRVKYLCKQSLAFRFPTCSAINGDHKDKSFAWEGWYHNRHHQAANTAHIQTQVFPTDLNWKTTLLLRAELALQMWRADKAPAHGKPFAILCWVGNRQKAERGKGLKHPSEATDMSYHHSEHPQFSCVPVNSLWMCRCGFLMSLVALIGNMWFYLLNLQACLRLALFIWNGVKTHKFTSCKANSDSSLKHMALYFLWKRKARAAQQIQRQDAR